MSLLNRDFSVPVCPRCNKILMSHERICIQCGYQLADMQDTQTLRTTPPPFTSQSGQSPLPLRVPVEQNQSRPSQFVRPSLSQGQGTRLSQFAPRTPSASTPSSSSTQFFPSSPSFIQANKVPQPVQTDQMTQVSWTQQPFLPSPSSPPSTSSMFSMPTLQKSQIMYSSGNEPEHVYRATQPVSAHISRKKEPLQSNTRRALLYFSTAALAIVILVFAVFRGAGASLSTLVGHSSIALTPTAYPMPKGTPLFADSFVDDSSGWNQQSVVQSYEVSVGNGKLSLEDDKNSLLWELLPGERTYDNFILTVNAALTEGNLNNGYGVYIRGTTSKQSDLATYYRFELYGDGSYAIFKGITASNDTSTDVKLTNYVVDAAIQKQHGTNRIMIIAKGSSLSFVVNGRLLTKITDTSYTSGSIALFVSNLPGAEPGAKAQFSQLAIYAA